VGSLSFLKQPFKRCTLLIAALLCVQLMASKQQQDFYLSFPAGCSKALQDLSLFEAFFEQSLDQLSITKGPYNGQLIKLHAFNYLRKDLAERYRSMKTESPVDRLLLRQLCHFESIWNKSNNSPQNKILSNEKLLHKHLLSIASDLYVDTQQVYRNLLSKKEKLAAHKRFLRSKKDDIQLAKSLGKEKFDRFKRSVR